MLASSQKKGADMPATIGDAFLWMAIAGTAIFLIVLAWATARETKGPG
jgi:hypothetical protein